MVAATRSGDAEVMFRLTFRTASLPIGGEAGKPPKRPWSWLVALVLLSAGACNRDTTASPDEDDGDDGGGTPTGLTPGEPPPDTALQSYARAYCELRMSCGCQSPGFPSVEACIDTFSGGLAGNEDWLDEACLQHLTLRLERTGCMSGDPEPPTCMDQCTLYHGTAPLGAACSFRGPDASCAPDLKCDLFSPSPICVERCPQTGLDGPCTGSFDCAEGLYCASSDVCRPRHQVGESCETASCVEGAICSLDSTCVVAPAIGEACIDHRCSRAAECDEATDVCVAGQPEVCL